MTTAEFATRDDPRRRLLLGGVCSLLLHAAGLGLLVSRPGMFAAPLPVDLLAESTSEVPVQPGITSSRQVTMNWLGFEEPTPHSATPAEIDQAALSPDAGGGGPEPVLEVSAGEPGGQPLPPDTVPVETTPAEQETTEAADLAEASDNTTETETAAESSEPETTPAEPAAEVVEAAGASDEADAEQAAAAPILAVRGDLAELPAARVFRALTQAASRAATRAGRALAEASAAGPARPDQPAETPDPGVPGAPPPGEPNDALLSEKEADPTSKEVVVEWDLGKPPAVEGLDITTVRPRWTVTTRLMAVPRNPLVRIEFRKNGTVSRAVFLEGQNTGHGDVDGPLLDAIYAWTARGVALDSLPSGDPKAVVPITMRIVLIPGKGTIHKAESSR